MNYTTIEQSNRLLELGLDPKTSDCNWQHAPGYENYDGKITGFWDDPEWGQSGDSKDLPCWSLGALLELIPDIPDCTILFAKSECEYGMCITPLDSGLALNEIEANNPFEVVYNMIVWLIENGYIKTEKK